ncbi:alpha/beta hydrolase [Erysipelothrix urinaevulpis]|uniref:alpha/beta hydrolase n=1 Tax=Erysipelothrix urinaevulpis TaxID=2683717 RepID=UPI00135A26C2|nr:alpha/beta hydrolase [Erysipelothrix urinaevulpis]
MENIILIGNPKAEKTILYIHGGGYVMGSANDLPQELQALFIENDYKILGLNYPLAPQVHVDIILEEIESMINQALQSYSVDSYSLLGRSSGGNAMLSINPQNLLLEPQSLLLFYTYASLDLSWMHQAIRNLDYPINKTLVETTNTSKQIQYSRSIDDFYSYYYSLRKMGIWPDTIQIKTHDILWDRNMPSFIIHSMFDPDVPYRCALELKDYFINSEFLTFTQKQHAIDHNLDIIDEIVVKLNDFLTTLKEENQ